MDAKPKNEHLLALKGNCLFNIIINMYKIYILTYIYNYNFSNIFFFVLNFF